MAIASMLSRSHDVTIVARNLPGDAESREWSSPWAGACFLGLDGSTQREQKMQRDSFAFLWDLAQSNPESSVRVCISYLSYLSYSHNDARYILIIVQQRIEMHDLQDSTPLENIWYRDLMPEVRGVDRVK